MTDLLLSPVQLGPMTLPNRVIFPAHQTMFAENGVVSDRLRAYYEARAAGGVGAIIIEGGAVHPTAVKFPGYLRLYDSRIVPSLTTLVAALNDHGTKVIVQLAHSGSRMPSFDSGLPLWAPSDVVSANSSEVPHAMKRDEIKSVIAGFVASARNAVEAGAQGIEIHGAHEYLLDEFFSEENNKRTDEYGGDLVGRTRFAEEVITAIRAETGDSVALGIRLSAHRSLDSDDGDSEVVAIAQRLAEGGLLDYIHVSAGTSATPNMVVPPMGTAGAPNLAAAVAVRDATGVPVVVVGRFLSADSAENALAQGVDGVAMARALIADPEFVNKTRRADKHMNHCIGINECYRRLNNTRSLGCAVNPNVGEELHVAPKTVARTKVLVVGGGIAGLEFAASAAERGARVTLVDAGTALGGQVALAGAAPSRRELHKAVEDRVARMTEYGVEVILERTIDAHWIRNRKADLVVLATGSQPRPSKLSGLASHVRVMDVPTAIRTAGENLDGEIRKEVAVIIDTAGDMHSYAPAQLLAEKGAHVTIVSSAPTVGSGLDNSTRADLLRRFNVSGVRMIAGATAEVDTAGGLRVVGETLGQALDIPASLVVESSPYTARTELFDELTRDAQDWGLQLHAIGDCVAPRGITAAIRDARRLAMQIN